MDSVDDAYIAGDTQSPDFPVLSAPQATFGGLTDAFVTKLGPTGTLLFSTFLGGAAAEHAGGIAVDSSNNAYVAGSTFSTNFPVLNAYSTSNAGGQDVFITKLKPSTLLFSTYLGGSGADQANGIAIDGSGNVYMAGVTTSANFPTSSGALRTAYNNFSDAFVAKLSASGSALTYGTYLGGSTWNAANGIVVDSSGDAYVVGATTSFDFPVVNAAQSTLNGGQNAFLSELAPSGAALTYSTFYGGTSEDLAAAVALDPSSNIYVGGQTSSSNLPLVSPLQSAYPGIATGWVMKFVQQLLAPPSSRSPANGATGITESQLLGWSETSSATSYEVYFGTIATPPYVTTTTAQTYNPGTLGAERRNIGRSSR